MTTTETVRAHGEDATFGERALERHALDAERSAPALARQTAIGLALAAIAGLAMGARGGAVAMAVHAAGVPIALLAVVVLGLPSLVVLLSLAGAPLDPRTAAAAGTRAVASSGLVLAGLAPAVALFVITSETDGAAALAPALGLALGGAIGLGHLAIEIARALENADLRVRALAIGGLCGFALFAVTLASRVWAASLPVLIGGAS